MTMMIVGFNQGPQRAKKSGVKHTPMGVWGWSPQRGSRGQSPRWGQGAKPPAADEIFMFKTVIFNASATVLDETMYCLSYFFCTVSK